MKKAARLATREQMMPTVSPRRPPLASPLQVDILQRLARLRAIERTLAERAGVLQEAYSDLLDARDRLARVTNSTPNPEAAEPDDVLIARADEPEQLMAVMPEERGLDSHLAPPCATRRAERRDERR